MQEVKANLLLGSQTHRLQFQSYEGWVRGSGSGVRARHVIFWGKNKMSLACPLLKPKQPLRHSQRLSSYRKTSV